MTTTAMYYSKAGAQRVTVIRDNPENGKTLIETRDGDKGWVETALLTSHREEEA
jgi:hypothetical protein